MSNGSPSGKPLTQDAFDEAADVLGIEAAKLWAVMEVEAKRCGFLEDRRPVILFERHKFHERTQGQFSGQHPDISHKDAGSYGKGGAHQHERFEKAASLDRLAAIWSTSWGLGQVMGFNAEAVGFADSETMVREMSASEDAQLTGMARFILKGDGLQKALRVGDWTSFARGYNGPKYYINKYDDRLRGAYQKFSTGPLPDLRVRAAQLSLTYLGHDPGVVDGWFGPNTLRALNDFRGSSDETDFLSDRDLELLDKAAFGRPG